MSLPKDALGREISPGGYLFNLNTRAHTQVVKITLRHGERWNRQTRSYDQDVLMTTVVVKPLNSTNRWATNYMTPVKYCVLADEKGNPLV